jgi:hypothetical protein
MRPSSQKLLSRLQVPPVGVTSLKTATRAGPTFFITLSRTGTFVRRKNAAPRGLLGREQIRPAVTFHRS